MKNHLKNLFLLLGVFLISLTVPNGVSYAVGTSSYNYTLDSTSSTLFGTYNIPDIHSVTSVSVSQGSVTYNHTMPSTVSITTSGGSYYSSYQPSASCSTSIGPQASSSFPSSTSCSASGYTGSVNTSGSPSSSTTTYPSVYKTATCSNTQNVAYNSTGSGTTTYSAGSATYCGTGSKPYGPDGSGYSGSLPWISTSPAAGCKPTGPPKTNCSTSFSAQYGGNVNKPSTTSYTQSYSGSVYGSTTYYYRYTGTIFYTVNSAPMVNITSPTGTSLASTQRIGGLSHTVTWAYGDADGDPQYSYRVQTYNANTNALVFDTGDVISSATSYTVSGLSYATNYYFRVTVNDNYSAGVTTSATKFLQTNTVPVPNVTFPVNAGTPRFVFKDHTVQWTYTDANSDPQVYYRIRVLNGATVVYDSGNVYNQAARSHTIPAGTLLGTTAYTEELTVFDGYDTGVTSYQIFTNQPASATITNPTGPTAGSPSTNRPTFNITWTMTDIEGNTQTKYQVITRDLTSGNVVHVDTGQVTSTTMSHSLSTALVVGRVYSAEVRVFDGYSWSQPSPLKYFEINKIPSVGITFPTTTTATNPDGAPIPFDVKWNFSDPDGDGQTQYLIQLYRNSNNALLFDSGAVASTGKLATIVSTNFNGQLVMGEIYYVRVQVYDGYQWSGWSQFHYFITNRPPTSGFTWQSYPDVVGNARTEAVNAYTWEGDTIQVIGQVDDPDKSISDPLTVTYTITYTPLIGAASTSTQTFSLSSSGGVYAAAQPGPVFVAQPGTYSIKQHVVDVFGAVSNPDTTKTITVAPLRFNPAAPADPVLSTFAPFVTHRSTWNTVRLRYNAKYNPDRLSDTFWAGEQFLLSTDFRNNTWYSSRSTTRISSVSVVFHGNANGSTVGDITKVLTATQQPLRYADELFRDDFESLNNGTYTLDFTITWNNGVTKVITVPIVISGKASEALKTNRSDS